MPSRPLAPATPPREQWSGRAAFVLATVGSAVGLGNIRRFSYVAGENGGGAFLLAYRMAGWAWPRPRATGAADLAASARGAAWRWTLRFVVPTMLVAILVSSALAH